MNYCQHSIPFYAGCDKCGTSLRGKKEEMTPTTEALMPCPFCGSKLHKYEDGDYSCLDCFGSTQKLEKDIWNNLYCWKRIKELEKENLAPHFRSCTCLAYAERIKELEAKYEAAREVAIEQHKKAQWGGQPELEVDQEIAARIKEKESSPKPM